MKLRIKGKKFEAPAATMPVVVTSEELEEAYRLDRQRDVTEKARRHFLLIRSRLNELFETDAERVTVTPENYGGGQRLGIVDAVGRLSDIGELRQKLARQAAELGGDMVCETTTVVITPESRKLYGRVLVSGLAVKTDQFAESGMNLGADGQSYSEMAENLDDAVDFLSDFGRDPGMEVRGTFEDIEQIIEALRQETAFLDPQETPKN